MNNEIEPGNQGDNITKVISALKSLTPPPDKPTFWSRITLGNWLVIVTLFSGFITQTALQRKDMNDQQKLIAEHDKSIKEQALEMVRVSSRVSAMELSHYSALTAVKDRREVDAAIAVNVVRITRQEENMIALKDSLAEIKAMLTEMRRERTKP